MKQRLKPIGGFVVIALVAIIPAICAMTLCCVRIDNDKHEDEAPPQVLYTNTVHVLNPLTLELIRIEEEVYDYYLGTGCVVKLDGQ